MLYSKEIRLFGQNSSQAERLTAAQRRRIREQKALILNRPPPPAFYEPPGVALEDTPWIFRFATPPESYPHGGLERLTQLRS